MLDVQTKNDSQQQGAHTETCFVQVDPEQNLK